MVNRRRSLPDRGLIKILRSGCVFDPAVLISSLAFRPCYISIESYAVWNLPFPLRRMKAIRREDSYG